MTPTYFEKYGPTAVIAGGSEGVGASYARLLADRGLSLVLVARRTEPLEELKAELSAAHPGQQFSAISVDLTSPDAAQAIAEHADGMDVGLLVYNAGSCPVTMDFVDNELAFAQRVTALNATTPMALTHHFGRRMKARGRGGMILVGSFASLAGNPTLAAYGAAKAFSARLAEALWFELKDFGVDVLGHHLGTTDTPFLAQHYPQAVGKGANPTEAAEAGLAALGMGPALFAAGAEEFVAVASSPVRAEAVQAMHASGRAFLEG